MQQGITRREGYEPTLLAIIGGRDIELESASMDRSLPDPLAGGTLTAASGELVAVEGPDVVESVATPWDPGSQWPPVPETPATVEMDTGSGPVSLLTNGRVLSAAGGTSDRAIDIEVADQYQSLDRSISWDAVAAHMPSLEGGEHGRYVGMVTTSITDLILRECGWFSVPPSPGYTMLRVPAQGSMWPDRGHVTDAMNMERTGYVRWNSSSWGVAAANVDASYTLAGAGYSIASRGGVELAAMTDTASESQAGVMYLDALSSDWATRVRLQWSNSRAYLRYWDGSAYQNAVSLNRADGLLYGTFEYVSATSVKATLRNGGQIITEVVTVPAALVSGVFSTARIWGYGRAGGFLFCAPSRLGMLADWTPNAVLYPRTSNRNALDVRPSIEGENCADLLAQQCEAEGATYWIDETGVLRWWDLARLEARSSVATLTSDDDITDAGFEWEHSHSSVRSRVSVAWREPLRTWSWTTSVDLWQGSGGTVQGGSEPEEFWINVPDDEVWIMPDTAIRRAPGSGSLTDFNRGHGSWYGARGDRGDGQDTWAQLMGNGSFLMSMERVTDRAFKMSLTWTGSLPVTQRAVGPEAGGSLWSARYEMNLPIIRGKGRYQFTDRLTYSTQTGPTSAPEHEIDAGWWIQDAAQAQYTADYAGARLTVPQPVLSSVALIPVPGLQLGDMVEVRDEAVTRLTIRGLVVEDSRSIDSGMDMSHAVAIRPLYVTRNGVSWAEWATAVRDKTWAQWATNQNSTWRQWGANPLLKEEVI